MTKDTSLTCTRPRLAGLLTACLLLAPGVQAASPQETLVAELTKWVAVHNDVPADQVTVAPFDARVSVQPCASAYAFDYPFVNRESVRVRCTKPAWQLFVKTGFVQTQPAPVTQAKPANQAAQTTHTSQAAAQSTTPAAPVVPESKMVLVATTNLTAGQLLQPEMVKLEKMDADKVNRSHLLDTSGLEGQELVRNLRAGEPIRIADLRAGIMIKKGELVQLTVGKTGEFQISVRLEAMQDGRLGEQIKLRNAESGRILGGIVTGKGSVRGS